MEIFFPILIFFSFISGVLAVSLLLPRLARLAQQPIYEEGPRWHIKKQGTPTMGGVGFVFALLFSLVIVCSLLIYAKRSDIMLSFLLNASFAVLNSLIGIFDDMKKIRKKQNEGLTPIEKIIYQSFICILYLVARARLIGMSTAFSILGTSIELGFFFYPLCLFVMLGIINCANLTDGVDGLASSVSFGIGLVIFLLSPTLDCDASLLGCILIGVSLAFLLFNLHPAKIFMGDSGSLFLGAVAVSACFSLANPFYILLIGGVYVIEGFSVVIQVLVYKLTHKRVFKMAPLHHHLELCGLSENKIAALGLLTTLLLSLGVMLLR